MWNKFLEGLMKNKRLLALVLAILLVSGGTAAVLLHDYGQKPAKETAFVSDDSQKQDTGRKEEPKNEDSSQDTEKTKNQEEDAQPGSEDGETELAAADKTGTSGKKTGKKNLLQKVVDTVTGKKNETEDSDYEAPDPKYTVTFYTNGGSNLAPWQVGSGARIDSLPTPYKDGYIFLGWYYDEGLSRAAAGADGIDDNLSLYAQYAKQEPLETIESVNFVSATDVQGDNFKIYVETEDKSLDAESVKAAITAKNLTDPTQTDIIEVAGGNGSFVISGKDYLPKDTNMEAGKGFNDGCTYRVSLEDSRLTFKDQPESAREYNFTTAKAQVLNLALQQDLTYISMEDVGDITKNGDEVESLSLALYQADAEGTLKEADDAEGEFVYTKGELQVGDKVSLYAGLRPDQRTLDSSKEENGDVAYVIITSKNGHTYTYRNAAPEDVIFEPDMLPVSVDADLDQDPETITVDNKKLDFSADVYANIDLDSQTTVDRGDFLLFYHGTFGIVSGEDAAALDSYGRILSVRDNGDGTTTIGFETVSWEEMQQAMDIYTKESISGSEMLEGADVSALEAQIEQQALDSGFAEEAAQYLGSLALATENFTKLSENMNLKDYKVTLEDGTPISPEELQLMASGLSVECKMQMGYPKATISVHPQKFDGVQGTAAAGKGLSVQLEVKAEITIGKDGSDNQLVIEVTGVFTEEVGLDMGVRSQAVWKVWGIFPYIAEYRVTANIDVLNYTGVEVNAIMMTKESHEKDDNDKNALDKGLDIADQIKELIDNAKDDGEDSDKEENANKLAERYKEMMDAESDWVKVLEQNIVDQEWRLPPALPIIAVNMEVNFVINVDACISVGFDFEYLTGKRYTYTIDVFAGKVYNDTVTLIEEQYEFDFYALGRLGVRAGLEFEFKVGLFSTDLDSVGFQAEAGAYTKMWGYFYYELKYTESEGRSQRYSGALLVDVGAYMEIGLQAQALNERFSTEYTLFEKEWPLWTAGRYDSIQDFNTSQEEMPYVKLKQHVRSTVLPDSVFDMTYLDLRLGDVAHGVYNDYCDPSRPEGEGNRKNFEITMTNEKFTYDPQTNTVMVNPDKEDKKLSGEMIITWVRYPLAFSSRPIQRTISLYWDNVRDGYVIVPYTNGGSYLEIINTKYEAKVEQPADPVKEGYLFAGWYADEELTVPYIFPEKMPAEDTNIYAKWTPAENTAYRVEHYKEQLLSGEYTLEESESFTGTTDSYVTPERKTYTGYAAPALQDVKIAADGSAVLRYYYPLEWHTVTFAPGVVGGEAVVYDLKYGGKVMAPMMAANGYTFTGWDKEVVPVMGTEDVVYTAQWSKNADTPYRVEYYVEDLDGSYRLQYLSEGTGFTGDTFSAEELRYRIVDGTSSADTLLTVENGIVFKNMTVKGTACESAAIDADGKTIIKINYERLKHTVTFDPVFEDAKIAEELYYEEKVSIPKVTRTGYTFAGWSLDGEESVEVAGTMGTENVTYKALWTANSYEVAFDKEKEDAQGLMANQRFVYDTEQKLSKNSFIRTAYDFAGWAALKAGVVDYADEALVKNLTAINDATVILRAVWVPREYTITYVGVEGLVHANPDRFTVESKTITLSAPIRAGYTFEGWYADASFQKQVTEIAKGSMGDKTLYAKWKANTDTPYVVEHYQARLDGSLTLVDTDYLTGTTDSEVTPERMAYTGFVMPQEQIVTINGDGSTVVRYEYARASYTITLDVAGGILNGESTITGLYESPVTLPIPEREGYGFDGWYVNGSKFTGLTMPAEDLTLIAGWIAGQYGYTVNHYRERVDSNAPDVSGNYALAETVPGTADMDSEVTGEVRSYTGFTSPAQAQTMKIKANAAANVINYYYTRNAYTLSWDLAGGEAVNEYTSGSVKFDASITVPKPVKKGYSYTWNETPKDHMPAGDLSYTALWTPNSYQVLFDVNGGIVEGEDSLQRTVTFDASYGALPAVARDGYTFDGWFTDKKDGPLVTAETIVSTDEDHVLYAHFTPISYKIHYEGLEDGTHKNPESYTIESSLIVLNPAAREGYTFDGWYETKDYSTEAVTLIKTGSMGEKTLYAKWIENSYTVIFHSNNGNDEQTRQEFTYTEKKALAAHSFARTAYSFDGWAVEADGAVKYLEGEEVSRLSGLRNGEVHLYAKWTPVEYRILYENMKDLAGEDLANAQDNPESFTIENNQITLHDPAPRKGYTFGGWYTDPALTQKAEGMLTLNSWHDWIFYAKWTANPYVIIFDSCLGESVPTETQLMTYDKAANLRLMADMVRFTKPGYTFLGWAVTKDGDVAYIDGDKVNNLAEQGSITLYAVWKLNVFSITYDLGTGGVSHTNPASYSIEDNDVKLANPVAKDGYEFLGWYEGDTLVKEIVKGTQKDFNLKARWGHGGYFDLYIRGREVIDFDDGTYGYKQTYVITRTLPEGTEATANPQHVYYRTVNGTAYGSTVEMSIAGDKYHFKHVGGEDVYATFGPQDMETEFTVEEWGLRTVDDGAAAFHTADAKERYYKVALYKIVDTVGTCKGQFGGNTTLEKEILNQDYPESEKYVMSADFYKKWYSYTHKTGETYVSKVPYQHGIQFYLNSMEQVVKNAKDLTEEQRNYVLKNSSAAGFRMTANMVEKSDGYQWIRFYANNRYQAQYIFEMDPSGTMTSWQYGINFPSRGTKQSAITFDTGHKDYYNTWAIGGSDFENYGQIRVFDSVAVELGATGKKDNTWIMGKMDVHYKMLDSRAPGQVGLSSLAFGQYKAGDTIDITVIYDEVIGSASNVGLSKIDALPLGNVEFVDGVGTNALHFRATVTKDFEVTPDTNNEIKALKPVTGTVKDVLGN